MDILSSNYKEVVMSTNAKSVMMYTALFKSLCMVCSHLSFSKNTISISDTLMTLEINYTPYV